jgi:hypothetical protein
MPPVRDVDRVRALPDALALAAEPLAAWLAAVGRAQLRYAATLAQPGAPRRRELGGARAVIARCRSADPVVIGARAIAPHVAREALAAPRLAHRLPRALGLAVLAELHSHADDPIEDAPTWAALADPEGAGSSSSQP